MRNILLIVALVLGTHMELLAGTEYAGELLSLGAGARGMGIGSACVAVTDDASAGYWNAAGLSSLRRREAILMYAERFAGAMGYSFAGVSMPLRATEGLGVALFRVGIDGIKYTALERPEEAMSATNRPDVYRTASNADYALYLSYGRQVRNGLALGGSVKLIRRKIGDNTAFGYGADVGLLYRLGAFSVGMNLRNLTSSPIHWDTGTMDRVLPSIDAGIAYAQQVPLISGEVIGSVAAHQDAEGRNQSGIDRLNMGVEYWYSDRLALRLGSTLGRFTAGMGLRVYRRIGIDYAFLQHSVLGGSHYVSTSLGL